MHLQLNPPHEIQETRPDPKAPTKKLDHAIRKLYKKNHQILPHLAVTWLVPSISTWGRNSSVFAALEKVEKVISKYNTGEVSKVKVLFHANDQQKEWEFRNRYRSHVRSAFSHGHSLYGDSLEILLVPGVIASVVFHYVPSDRPYLSFPIGYTTTNAQKVQEISALVEMHFKLSNGEFTAVIPPRPNKLQFLEICPEFQVLHNIVTPQEENETESLTDEIQEEDLIEGEESEEEGSA